MKLIVNDRVVALSAETPADEEVIARVAARVGHVFELMAKNPGECRFVDLGLQAFACREPINIVWTDHGLDERWKPISNLAPTPFELDGERYQSVEGFWQGLKFKKLSDRRRIAAMTGPQAMHAGREIETPETLEYLGIRYPVGRHEHWNLMRSACHAKFTQDESARVALLSTGERLLTHKVRRDSRTIPGAIMADIWMDVRSKLRSISHP